MAPSTDIASFPSEYLTRRSKILPRLPLKGNLDLTYRCNFNCRHCWLRASPDAAEKHDELNLEEIMALVDAARAMGCREWAISGGEPLLRPDFPEIFDYLTCKASNYFLNTNGALITPETAKLLRRKGIKMVALYGATPEIHDHVTRTPGSFDLTMRGFSYLQEAGAGFMVQLIPMRANWHQWDAMLSLAQSLSPQWRVGASWLYLSSTGSDVRNVAISAQRLPAEDVIRLAPPHPEDDKAKEEAFPCSCTQPLPAPPGQVLDDRLYARCIEVRRDFHVDPYGKMTFCSFIKDPALRYDLRRGTFQDAWDKFIPSLADRVRGGDEYRNSCGSCEQRADCRWCPVYAYLEKGRHAAAVPYLCEIAAETRRFKRNWLDKHRRYFQLAGMTICVESDLDFDTVDFKPELKQFAVAGPGDDNITIRHHLGLPNLRGKDLGEELYRKAPWAISRRNHTWYYLGISPKADDPELHRIAVFNADYTEATIYSPVSDAIRLRQVGFQSLSLFPTDQIWLAPLLADRSSALFHSAAAILNGQGLLFVGHSEAGKSTTIMMLQGLAATGETPDHSIEILCDDRNVVRRWDTGWRVHGTWSHGDVHDVSPASAPLRAVLFLQQAEDNEIAPLTNRKEIWKRLLSTLIKPMVTAEWWQKEFDVLEQMVRDVPFYTMHFDKSGKITEALKMLTTGNNRCWK